MDAPAARYVKTNDGYDIAYYARGSGPTLIRVPMLWNHVSRQWAANYLGPTYDALAERFRLVLYDGRGQGLSTRGLPESLSLDDCILDLEAVADRVEPGRFVLMGWAQMSVVAIKYACEHPERVIALVLREYEDFGSSPTTLIELASKDWRRFVETTARIGFPWYDPALVKDVLFDAMSQSDHVAQAKAIRGVSGEELLRQLNVPTLLLASRTGTWPFSAEEAGKKWATLIPDAELRLFDGEAAGWPASEGRAPEAVLAIASFLGSLSSSAHEPEERDVVAGAPPRPKLSPRQAQVLALLVRGKSNGEIANELVLSVRTVERHLAEAYAKIGAHNRYEAIALSQSRLTDSPTE